MSQYLEKLHSHLPFDPAIPHLGICPKYTMAKYKKISICTRLGIAYYLQKKKKIRNNPNAHQLGTG